MNRFPGLILATVFCWNGLAGEGSNLGTQATQYQPPTMSGVVSTDAGPAGNAVLTTLSGQSAVCDASGNYQLTVDAPGIYRVTVRKGVNILTTDVVELAIGQKLDQDFDLGQNCAILVWPQDETILTLLDCMIANQSSQPERSAP